MAEKICYVCGNATYQTKLVEYLYRHNNKYLLVRNVPAEVCDVCGTRFYQAAVLQEIERRFFEIHQKDREPLEQIQLPVEVY